jgi:hypothetical protein
MNAAMRLTLSTEAYERFLRVLGAWWCLGSSALQPATLARHEARR